MNKDLYFKPLTGIRAAAAYLIFLHHFPPLYGVAVGPLSRAFFNELHIGVTIFFTLSGFLITIRYLDRVSLTRADFTTYLTNRFARIFPTYFVLTCVAFVFISSKAGFSTETVRAFLLNISLLRGFSEFYRFSGIPQGWSLTVEETFYLSAPFLFYFLRKFNRRHALLVLAAYVLLAMAVGALLTQLLHGRWRGFFADYSFLFTYTFFGRAFEFATGAALALLLLQRAAAVPRVRSSAGWFTWLGLAGSLLPIGGLMALRQHYHLEYGSLHPLGMVLNTIILPGFIACGFYGLLHEHTLVARLLSHPVADVLGKSSYSFYLLHHSFPRLEQVLRLPATSYPRYLVLFLLLVAISIGCYYLLEEPCNQFIRRLQSAKAPEPATLLAQR